MKLALILLSTCIVAQQTGFKAPDDIEHRKAGIMSEGTRMAAEIFVAKAAGTRKLPAVLMAHGWGGTIPAMRSDAVAFARAGYFVVAFDYRGWGESDSRVATVPGGGKQDVREVVDPLDMGADWLNAMHWLVGEPQCDTNRIGLWGSSFSGGLVAWVAARDPRVKAFHSQVGAFDGRELSMGTKEELAKTYDEATKRARGEIGYPPPRAKVIGNLQGAPIRARFLHYAPVDDIVNAPNCAMQFVLAENEELFDNRNHGIKAFERAKGPKNMVIIPKIKHYGIYYEARLEAQKLAIQWYDKHLK
jgi:dienelactone hydrolase